MYKYTCKILKRSVQPLSSYRVTKNWQLTHAHTHAHTHTRTHTHPYIFGWRLFFQCRSYINKGNGEIRQLIFETDSRLYSIKDWESKKHKRYILLGGAWDTWFISTDEFIILRWMNTKSNTKLYSFSCKWRLY